MDHVNHETRVHPFPPRPSAETVSTIADSGRGVLAFLRNPLNGFFHLERFGGDSDFEVGDKASSLSFHSSDFGLIRPSQNR